eukprot:CAMPEP_0115545086 /NCGR_PEP_ID=MMETSP0271-20121206/92424_1 /TAXON_ID=71861 /ORGANISM="Scrippsiella trochoidea, Strain CCMP3099" /LENGTH=140 /DNA_ID=CAMNT_0002978425 /DNA_START=113 /DNA_END=532 /DNA_ORIENTATION=-
MEHGEEVCHARGVRGAEPWHAEHLGSHAGSFEEERNLRVVEEQQRLEQPAERHERVPGAGKQGNRGEAACHKSAGEGGGCSNKSTSIIVREVLVSAPWCRQKCATTCAASSVPMFGPDPLVPLQRVPWQADALQARSNLP